MAMKFTRFALLTALCVAVLPDRVSAQDSGESVMVAEAYSGKVLVASNPVAKRPVASLTKIATAAIACDWAAAAGVEPANVTMTVPQSATLVGGPNPMNLQPGDRISLRDALNSALLGSDNLAALTIADHVGQQINQRRNSGGDPVATFVGEMNQLVKALGMRSTRFTSPHGLDAPGKSAGYSTAADMAKLSIYAMRRNAITFIVRQKERQVSVDGAGGRRSYRVVNTNEMIGEPGVIGLKTGTTAAAGPCLAVVTEKTPLVRTKPDGQKGVTPRRLVVVVLNSPDRFGRARGLIQQGWSIYDAWLANGAPVQDAKREILSVPNPF